MPRHILTHQDRQRAGHTTLTRHGVEHMREIGKRGAKTFWSRYTVEPAGTSGWVILTRDTRQVVNFIGSVPGRLQKG